LVVIMIAPKYSVRQTLSRFFVTHDGERADRLISWLDRCGYTIVAKPANSLGSRLCDGERNTVTRLVPDQFIERRRSFTT
jgi:hypothetical protein